MVGPNTPDGPATLARCSLSESDRLVHPGGIPPVRPAWIGPACDSPYELWCGPCQRWVAARTAAASTGIPPERSVCAAASSVLPVVTRSSTSTTVAGRRAGRNTGAEGRNRNFPVEDCSRSAAVCPAASGVRVAVSRTGSTDAGTPLDRSRAAASRHSRSTCCPPRALATAGWDGTGTSRTALGEPSGRACSRSASPTAPASASASWPARSRRPRSLYASSAARTGPW
jgi:hypothetical protein